MKTVYSADMVCHLWANGHAHDIRTPTNNLFTRDGALYSYGRHHIVGAFIQAKNGPLLLLNANRYSATTAKHASKARQALPPHARSQAVTVPRLDDANFKNLPALARDCMNAAIVPLEKCEKARENLSFHVSTARGWFDSARRLYEAAGDKKAALSVPTLASDAGKPEAAQILAAMNRATYTVTMKKNIEEARVLVEIVRAIDTPTPRARWVAQMINRAMGHVKTAKDNVTRAGLKRPPVALAQFEKTLKTMAAQWQGPALAEQASEDAHDIAQRLQALRGELRDGQIMKKQGKANRATSWALSKLEELTPKTIDAHAVAMWGDDAPARFAEVQTVLRRARAVNNAHILARSIQTTGENIAGYAPGDRYVTVPNGDGLRQRVRMWEGCPAFWASRALAMADKADTIKAAHAERVALANAERIIAWRAGERVTLSRDVGPLVRIMGEQVETSWGATVPLAHAVRLLKLARAIQARGGQQFNHGEGPAVGHFRVNTVRADFSMVIGCHPFTAEECEHAARLIEACEEVTA